MQLLLYNLSSQKNKIKIKETFPGKEKDIIYFLSYCLSYFTVLSQTIHEGKE